MTSEGRRDVHELLPWYVSAALDPEETAAVKAHLPGCDACRKEMEFLRALQQNITAGGEEFLAPHLAPADLVTEVMEGLPGPKGAEVRRHLSLCSTCAVEARIVRHSIASWPAAGDEAADSLPTDGRSGDESPGSPPPLAIPGRRGIRPWAFAAVVVLAISLPIWWKASQEPSRTGLAPAHFVGLPERDAAGAVIRLSAAEEIFQLVLPVETSAQDFPISLAVTDESGRTILVRDDVDASHHYRDRFLFVICDRQDFPDGNYRVTIRTRDAARPLEFPFRVATAN